MPVYIIITIHTHTHFLLRCCVILFLVDEKKKELIIIVIMFLIRKKKDTQPKLFKGTMNLAL
jgi:hypothetical protein